MRTLFAKILRVGLICLTASILAYSQTNEYRDNESGVSLSLPPGWRWSGPERLRDQESVLFLKEPGTLQVVRLYVKILQPPEKTIPAEKMNRRLLKQAKGKVEQQTKEGYENYRLREDSCQLKAINGRSALSWVADYTQNGHNMAEYFTRSRSEKANALFYSRLPPEQFDDFKARIDPVIETLQIP
jgi:hypothetical protein